MGILFMLLQNQCLITVLTALLHDERSLELAYTQNYDDRDVVDGLHVVW